MRLHFFSGFQHTSPVHALLDLQLFHFLVIIGGEVDNGKVPTLPEAPLGTAPAGGGTSRCQEVGVTGWLLSLLRQLRRLTGGTGCLPLSCHSSSRVWASPGLELCPLGFPRCPSSSTCEAGVPGLSGPPLPAKARPRPGQPLLPTCLPSTPALGTVCLGCGGRN